MLKVIAIYRADGGVSILRQPPGAELNLEENLDKWRAVADPSWLPAHAAEIDDADLPNANWRDAWRHSDGEIVISLDAAREVTKRRLRISREPLLKNLDVQFMRAVESGDASEQARIAAKKQALRDVTSSPAFAAVRSPDDLALIVLPA